MSTVGKVLVVAQIAFSVLLMAFAAGVSSVQTNWKQREQTAKKELEKTKRIWTRAPGEFKRSAPPRRRRKRR